jgi:magnesium and cobalt transporter
VISPLDDTQPERRERFLRRLLTGLGIRTGPIEIQEVIDKSEEQGLIDEIEGDMIEGIFDLKSTVVREIMIPRTHVVFLSSDSCLQDVLTRLIESGHSRIPVYNQNVDQIVGILNSKDLLPLWLSGGGEPDLASLCREPYFVPETKPIKDLLAELRARKSHMAIVVDEYGGTAGIVTLEDIVEEIVGEISDEHDVEEELFIERQNGSVVVNARAGISELEEWFGIEVLRGAYDTVGGLIIHLMGRVPKVGEEIEYEGLSMKITAGDEKRIVTIEISRPCEDAVEAMAALPESTQ